MKLFSALQLIVLVSNKTGVARASTKSPIVGALTKTTKHHEHNNAIQEVLPHWTDMSYKPSTTSSRVEEAFISTFQPLVVNKAKRAPLRLALFVEPCPLTYVSGYANRFQELLRHLERQMAEHPGSALEIVTAENIVKDRPSEAFGFPVRYTKGFLLPFYPIMTIAFDYTLQTFRSVRSMKPNLIHASSP
jgi:hypothetical protein